MSLLYNKKLCLGLFSKCYDLLSLSNKNNNSTMYHGQTMNDNIDNPLFGYG